MRSADVLYISFDGVLEPLGYSQVARVVMGLARRGWRYTLLSFERAADLRDAARTARVAAELEGAGVDWVRCAYAEGGRPWHGGANLARAAAAVGRVAAARRVRLVHARSYVSGAVALGLRRALGVPYLFDFRGYWIDERADFGRWFARPRVLWAGKALERALFAGAAAAVSLSQVAADDLTAGRVATWDRRKPLAVIPTCADFDAFGLRTEAAAAALPPAVAARLQGKLVLGYLGAINPYYCTDDALALFRAVRRRRADAHLLCLTRQADAMARALAAHDVPPESYTLADAPHDQVARWMHAIDWGFLLLRPAFAERAAMPTKLAEFLAAGVRPIHYGCNDEVGDWVRRCGSGHSLPALGPADLERAADVIAAAPRDAAALHAARERARPHFSLASGIDRYDALLAQLLPDGRAAARAPR